MRNRQTRVRLALRHRPVLKAPEAWTVLSAFTVTNVADSGAGSLVSDGM
jgi:hypothetical protein